MKIEEFKTLKATEMRAFLKERYPADFVGMSRAGKEALVSLYEEALRKGATRPLNERILGILDTSSTPEPEPGPEPEVPEGQVLARQHPCGWLYFAVVKGDPRRNVTTKEARLVDRCVELIPKMERKQQSAPPGVPGRKVHNPSRRVGQELRTTLKALEWAGIRVLPPQQKATA